MCEEDPVALCWSCLGMSAAYRLLGGAPAQAGHVDRPAQPPERPALALGIEPDALDVAGVSAEKGHENGHNED
jgi:hypothetical protein